MERLSSNLTLFFKFFVPVFWIVFFGAFTIAVFAYKNEFYGEIPGRPLRIGSVVFFASGLIMFYFTSMRLKRVEGNGEHLIITDYFKTFRYAHTGVDKITESKFAFIKLVTIHLKEKGSFGLKIPFIASASRYEGFMKSLGAQLPREKA
ncbi:MAG: hypothetical protein KTR30_33590 [Saprospiraceae bacterium]|nr:hypothetical protein [Saprospiraceae bacterium]